MPLDETSAADSFPRRYARTQRFTLGQPRAFAASRGGERVLFLRTRAGDDPVSCLWLLDTASGEEWVLADPRTLLADGRDEELPPEERARRERLREGGSGIVAYSTDQVRRHATFALGGELWLTDVVAGTTRRVDGATGVIDPRLSPHGRHIAYVGDGALWVVGTDEGAVPTRLVGPGPEESDVTWGLAEFVAAEEMGRYRGFWWGPQSDRLLVARVDESPVPIWHIADPANPDHEPRATRYPAAGSADALVTLWLVELDGTRTEVEWDHDAFPYLTTVNWEHEEYVSREAHGAALVQVMSRSQRDAQILKVRQGDGSTHLLRELHDDAWIDVVPGLPTWGPMGELLTVEPRHDEYQLCVDGRDAGRALGHQVGGLLHLAGGMDPTGALLVIPTEDPSRRDVVTWIGPSGPSGPGRTGDRPAGLYAYVDGLVELSSTWMTAPVATITTHDDEFKPRTHVIRSFAEDPGVVPRPHLLRTPEHDIVTAVFLPTDHVAGTELPVLMSPYGGPHAQRVLAARNAHLESQWLADQGFAVVVADGRGTPRSPSWERAVHLDLATIVLDDQVEALHAATETHRDLDLTRVAIRGWSFGGYLAALAVLRRPDVFHAAVAGAPVTDWRLYDTFYTERYLGHPDEHPEAYAGSSLIDEASDLTRPLMLIHGLADDNVVSAHTLRFSSALLAAGRAHTVLPLSGVTHMTPQEVVAENLLLLQVDFLREALSRT